MSAADEPPQRLIEIVRQDAQARAAELAHLNELLEERTQMLERQLGRRASTAKWFAVVAGLLAIIVGIWVYTLMQGVSGSIEQMSHRVGGMQTYMKHMGAGQPPTGEASFMSAMARDTDKMTVDIGLMREAMQQLTGDIGAMRTGMEGMRGDIGSMNKTMRSLGRDMQLMNKNVAGMAQSMARMDQSVSRLSYGADSLRAPFPTMDSVMPWR